MSAEYESMRRQYAAGRLDPEALLADPLAQFQQWFDDVVAAGVSEANAMALATAIPTGMPSVRMVLLKGVDRGGFVFYTNYGSRKARELADNPHAALLWHWGPVERNVRVEGSVAKLTQAEVEAYFHSRPHGSRVGAWVSHQSQVIPNYQMLEDRWCQLEQQYAGQDVPVPPQGQRM